MQQIKGALERQSGLVTAADLAGQFTGRKKRRETVAELLETLIAIGQARQTDDNRYVA